MKKGLILVNALVFGSIAIIIIYSMVNWSTTVLKTIRNTVNKEQALQIAEAGIDYYRWHLAHYPSDYHDGNPTTSTGPYSHDFLDKDGNKIGRFELTITPPAIGSTLVQVVSKGIVDVSSTTSRSIKVGFAIPSLAKYAVAANDIMRFGAGTEVFGPIHSNNGIRFDGVAHNLITSSKQFYTDTDPNPDEPNKFGVYTTVSPEDPDHPAAVPVRLDVFQAGRQFPVPTIDFNGFTSNLSAMKTSAQSSGGFYRVASGGRGYLVQLQTDDTFRLYRINNLQAAPNNCTDSQSQDGWGTWSIRTSNPNSAKTLLGTYAFPTNGILFFEDHVWVEGTINTARLTIVAATLPDQINTRKSITVNNNLRYTNNDGRDVIALIAQNNINVGLLSQNDLYIDAAMIAQNGRVGRYYYSSNCGTGYDLNSITLYGMLASNLRYGFAYTDGTGYNIRNIIYDGNLLYSPPPSFPLTSTQYTVVSWEEI